MIKNKNIAYLYSVNGNKFVIIYKDQKNTNQDKKPKTKVITELCNKTKTDGLVLLHKHNSQFVWDFYNKDGSFAAFCGNAARCVSDLIIKQTKKNKGFFYAGKLRIFFQKKNGQVRVKFKRKLTKKRVQLKTGKKQEVTGIVVNSGVPHFVIFEKKNKQLAKKMRSHPFFKKEGTNVTFVTNIKKPRMNAVSFERGVEDFTLACGTGAIAAAAAVGLKKSLIKMPGGVLKVEIKNSEVKLTGKVILLKKIKYGKI